MKSDYQLNLCRTQSDVNQIHKLLNEEYNNSHDGFKLNWSVIKKPFKKRNLLF